MEQVLKTMLENMRAKSPLVHNITNYVTVNDVANVLLAAGDRKSTRLNSSH